MYTRQLISNISIISNLERNSNIYLELNRKTIAYSYNGIQKKKKNNHSYIKCGYIFKIMLAERSQIKKDTYNGNPFTKFKIRPS